MRCFAEGLRAKGKWRWYCEVQPPLNNNIIYYYYYLLHSPLFPLFRSPISAVFCARHRKVPMVNLWYFCRSGMILVCVQRCALSHDISYPETRRKFDKSCCSWPEQVRIHPLTAAGAKAPALSNTWCGYVFKCQCYVFILLEPCRKI